ncbi:MAG: ABC transporter permease [Herpetosiphonaceae bacterium]|nr:MAG: ABC transporter permease [Herpetosiphonaceae bacterium]
MPSFLSDLLTSTQWPGSIAIGLAYAAVVLGVFITFRILAFPDLTIDGSFPLGAAVAAVLLMRFGWNHWSTLPAATFAGAVAGATTALLAARLRINGLLASILVALALNSINLRILGQGVAERVPTANLPIAFNAPDVTDIAKGPMRSLLVDVCLAADECITPAVADRYAAILVFLVITALLVILLHWFLNTELGLALRATGDNEQMVRAQGINPTAMRVIGLALSNGLIALSGALYARYQGFADVTLGRGLIIVGLASVIIGEVVLPPSVLRRALLGAALGAVLYRVLITLALNTTGNIGLQESDLQLITAVIVIVALAAPQLRRYFAPRRAT